MRECLEHEGAKALDREVTKVREGHEARRARRCSPWHDSFVFFVLRVLRRLRGFSIQRFPLRVWPVQRRAGRRPDKPVFAQRHLAEVRQQAYAKVAVAQVELALFDIFRADDFRGLGF